MRVELAIFEGDNLLSRNEISIRPFPQSESLALFKATHQLVSDSADIVLSDFAAHIDLKNVKLDMPIHESEDWESIDLGKYTLAFWCRLKTA